MQWKFQVIFFSRFSSFFSSFRDSFFQVVWNTRARFPWGFTWNQIIPSLLKFHIIANFKVVSLVGRGFAVTGQVWVMDKTYQKSYYQAGCTNTRADGLVKLGLSIHPSLHLFLTFCLSHCSVLFLCRYRPFSFPLPLKRFKIRLSSLIN